MMMVFFTSLTSKIKSKIGSKGKRTQLSWDTKGVMKTYGLPEYEASLIVIGSHSYEEFNKAIASMQNEFDIGKDAAIATLARWAVEYHATKDIDEMVWRENNRLCGISDHEIQT